MFDESAVLDGLNERQRLAATHQGGPLLVLAGAGTGKTRTLVARAAWLRGSQGVPASRILLLTFTRRAASDMLARTAAWFDGSADGVEGSGRICGGTFHAIAHKIIRQHAESFSLPPQFTILDQGDATDLMDVLRPDHGLGSTGQRAPRAAACADIYTRCVNTGRPVSEVVTASFPWCAPFTGQLAGLFRAYTARKRAGNLLDFDDLLLFWQAALADPVAGPVLRGMFDAVLVDEYQDVNAVQASIVRLLQPDGKQLTCVGDDAQAIYGFRGADPAHLRQLTADYPGLDVVRLDRNYRSREGILDLANLIRPSSPGLDLTLTSDRGAGRSGEAPLLVRCHDEATQAREICARVLEAHEDGAALRDQAVLVDEYQDVNAVQASIVRLLQPDGKQLTCVGDDAQAIYGFRGADPAHLRRLAADYPGLDIVRLDRNYRSRQGVLDLANLIRPSAPGLDLRLTGDRGPGVPPLLVRCHDEATQAREICTRILASVEDGAALRDQAVLVRTGHHSDLLEIELSARKIPYVKFGGLRFTDTAHVRDFLAVARILANPADDLAWFRLLRLHDGIGPGHARRVLDILDPDTSGQDLPPGGWP